MKTAPTAGIPRAVAPLGATLPDPTTRNVPSTARVRLASIDLLRGLVMVIMMLDHTRDFINNYSLRYDPTDLSHTNAALFFTRWVTHFCAPVFVFLAGTGAYLQRARGTKKPDLAKFLATRGLWLIVLEFTLVRFGFTFNMDYRFFGAAQVIWVIGLSMIVLAGLIYLPVRFIGAFGVAVIALHNLLDGIQVQPWRGPGTPTPGLLGEAWMILHQPGAFPIFGGPVVVVIYPLIPWVGVMAAGYAFGAVYRMEGARRRRLLVRSGAALTLAFIVLRSINIYGDPQRWSIQNSALFTVLSFLNTTKYPPSLLFLLMTLGPAIAALALFERPDYGPIGRALVILGRVPLFFYLLQWPVAHVLALLISYLAGKPTAYLLNGPPGAGVPSNAGFDLWVVYLMWAAGVLLLYPLCLWYAGVKQRHRHRWLSYL